MVMKSVYRVSILFLGLVLSSIVLFTSCANEDYDIFSGIYGVVTDYETGAPIAGASVVLSPSVKTILTAADGSFSYEDLDAQQYTLTVQKAGYQPNRKIVTAVSGEHVETNIQLTKIPQ